MSDGIGRLEGSGGARFINLIRRNAAKAKDIDITVATVTKAPPALAIRIDGDPFDILGDELVVSEHLLDHARQVSVNGGAYNTHQFRPALAVGDKVIVVIAQDGQLYYVLDKVV